MPRLVEVDTTDRADDRIVYWDDAAGVHKYKDESAGGASMTLVRKTADEIVNNSTTLQNDDHLLLALLANTVWEFQLVLWFFGANSTADIKLAFTVPAGATLWWAAPNFLNVADGTWTNLVVEGSGTSRDFAGNATGKRIIVASGLVTNGATPGDLQLQWAQNALHASDTTVFANSTLKGWQLV